MRRFTFLDCFDCRFFMPRGDSAPTNRAAAAFLGVCSVGGRAEWVVWRSLDHAARQGAACPDREALPRPGPRCRLFEATAESLRRPYPESCLYRGTPGCQLKPAFEVGG